MLCLRWQPQENTPSLENTHQNHILLPTGGLDKVRWAVGFAAVCCHRCHGCVALRWQTQLLLSKPFTLLLPARVLQLSGVGHGAGECVSLS